MTASKSVIEGWLRDEEAKGCTHMIVFYESYDGIDYRRYVKKGQKVQDVIDKEMEYGNTTRVMEIYNFSMDLQDQLDAKRVWNI